MTKRLPDRDPEPGREAGWEVCGQWKREPYVVVATFNMEIDAVEECERRERQGVSSLWTWYYRYRPGWVGEEVAGG